MNKLESLAVSSTSFQGYNCRDYFFNVDVLNYLLVPESTLFKLDLGVESSWFYGYECMHVHIHLTARVNVPLTYIDLPWQSVHLSCSSVLKS